MKKAALLLLALALVFCHTAYADGAEPGLLRAAADHGVKLYTYSAKELSDMEGSFSFSAFVEQVTGVSNVCERAAMFHAGEGAELVKEKLAENGVTVAVARRKDRIVTWET